MSQRDAILSQIIEFANNSWRIYFDKMDDGYKIQFSQRFDSYAITSSELTAIKETFKAERATANYKEGNVTISVIGIPEKYFDPAFEKMESR